MDECINSCSQSIMGSVLSKGDSISCGIIYNEINKYKNDIVRDIVKLVRCKSVAELPKPGMPFGAGPYNALQCALGISRDLGLKAVDVDGYAGYAEYGEGDEYIGVLVHLDVVPEGMGWTFDPYEGVVNDGIIYGRGAGDNKASAVVAVYTLKVLKDLGVKTKRKVRVIFGTNEETGMECMDYYFKKEPLPLYGFSPDAGYPAYNREKGIFSIYLNKKTNELKYTDINYIEAGTAFNVVPEFCRVCLKKPVNLDLELLTDITKGEPGKVYYEGRLNGNMIVAKGKPAHGSTPEDGMNAVSVMSEYLFKTGLGCENSDILKLVRENIGFEPDGKSLGIYLQDEQSGSLSNNLGLFKMDENNVSIGLNIRYPVTFSGDLVLELLKQKLYGKGIDIIVDSHSAPLYVPENHPLIIKLMSAYEKVTGEKGELKSMGGGTYARKLQNRGVAFGGTGHNIHKADEYVVIEELMRHAGICTQAVYELVI